MARTRTARNTLPEDALGAWLELSQRRSFHHAPALVLALGLAVALAPLIWWNSVILLDAFLHCCGQGGLEASLDIPLETCMARRPWQSFRWALGVGGLLSLVLLPILVATVHASRAARGLGSLRRQGVMEELASTQVTSTRLVDGLVAHAAGRTARALALPLAVAGLLLLEAGPQAPSAGWVALAMTPVGIVFYYLVAQELWLRRARGAAPPWLSQVPVALCLGTPLVLLALAMAAAVVLAGPWLGAAAGALGALLLVPLYRGLSLQGLDEASPLRRGLAALERSLSGRRTRCHRDGTDNALLFRERAVRSGSGLAGLVRGHTLALAAGLGILLLATGPAWAAGVPAVILLLLVASVAALRALVTSSRALATERQQRTLEVLQQSGVPARDFVRGWSSAVATVGRVDVWLIFLAGSLAALGRGDAELAAWMLLLGAGALATVDSAAAWGVACAGAARSRFEVLLVTVTFLSVVGVATGLAGVLLGLPALAIAALFRFADPLPLPLAGSAAGLSMLAGAVATGALGRHSAVRALLHRPDRPGFTDESPSTP